MHLSWPSFLRPPLLPGIIPAGHHRTMTITALKWFAAISLRTTFSIVAAEGMSATAAVGKSRTMLCETSKAVNATKERTT
jgi:hypothetical protein